MRPVSSGAASVAPSALANQLHRYDAALDVTGTTSVTAWGDQVGTYDLANGAAGPELIASDADLGGLPSLQFVSGSSEEMSNGIAVINQPCTFYMLLTVNTTHDGWLVSTGNNTFIRVASDNSVAVNHSTGGGFGSTVSTFSYALNTAYLFVMYFGNTASQFWVNNTEYSFDASAFETVNFGGLVIGSDDGSRFCNINIAVCGFVSGLMSADDRSGLYAWAQANGGVA